MPAITVILKLYYSNIKLQTAYSDISVENNILKNTIKSVTDINDNLTHEKKYRQDTIGYITHDLTGMIDDLMTTTSSHTKYVENSHIIYEQMLHLLQNMIEIQRQEEANIVVHKDWNSLPTIIDHVLILISDKIKTKKMAIKKTNTRDIDICR